MNRDIMLIGRALLDDGDLLTLALSFDGLVGDLPLRTVAAGFLGDGLGVFLALDEGRACSLILSI